MFIYNNVGMLKSIKEISPHLLPVPLTYWNIQIHYHTRQKL